MKHSDRLRRRLNSEPNWIIRNGSLLMLVIVICLLALLTFLSDEIAEKWGLARILLSGFGILR